MTYQECAAVAAGRLERAGFPPADARVDAALLARSLAGWDLARWFADRHTEADADFVTRLDAWISRRTRHEPVAYIVGTREFFGRDFGVTPAVLIPRPDTETVVTAALECLDALDVITPLVLDVGTGSGCLAVTLAAERPGVRAVGIDVSPDALGVARANAARHGVSDRVAFRHAGARDALGIEPHLIVSNPPYLREDERATLAATVAAYEPGLALFAGADGLEVIRDVIAMASRSLATPGWLVMEIGYDQADAVRSLATPESGLESARVATDIEGRPRAFVARRS